MMNSEQGTMGSAFGSGRRAIAEEVPVGYKRTEVGVIPSEWQVSTVGAVADIRNGGTPNTQNPDYWNGNIAWCIPTDVTGTQGKYLSITERRITAAGLANCAASILPAGSLLLCSRATIGDVRISTIPICTNQGFKPLICKEGTDSEFLYYITLTLKPRMIERASGSTFLEVSKGDLSSIRLPVPPLAEQRAIAEALSDVDKLLAALEALIAKKRAIKQAAMQQLLTGKSRLPGFSGTWETKRIADLFESKAGGDFDPNRSSDVQSDRHPYPIYANGLSQEGLYGFCDYAENRLGSITVTARGTLGKAFYRDTPFVAIGRLLVLEPKVRMDARYFSDYINYGVHFAVESTGVPQLTAPQIACYSLPVPPELEQRAIASVLSDMDADIAALERRRVKTRAVKQSMMQQLLTGRVRLVEPEARTKKTTT